MVILLAVFVEANGHFNGYRTTIQEDGAGT
jgi:hypothetical protein